MPIQNYKYSRKYVVDKVKSHKLLYAFLIKERIYNKYIKACMEDGTIFFNIERLDFIHQPFMCFDWNKTTSFSGYTCHFKYRKFFDDINEEI